MRVKKDDSLRLKIREFQTKMFDNQFWCDGCRLVLPGFKFPVNKGKRKEYTEVYRGGKCLECRAKQRREYSAESKISSSGNYTLLERINFIKTIEGKNFRCTRCKIIKTASAYDVYINVWKRKRSGEVKKRFQRNGICKKCRSHQSNATNKLRTKNKYEQQRDDLLTKVKDLSETELTRVFLEAFDNFKGYHRNTFLNGFIKAIDKLSSEKM